MSLVARVVRQFHEGAEAVSLERVLTLPAQPTMGTLAWISAPRASRRRWEVVGLTLRPVPSGPGFRPPDLDVFLAYEPLEAATPARELGWRHPESA